MRDATPRPPSTPPGSLLVTGIGHLVTNDPEEGEGLLGVRDGSMAVACEDGRVTWIGPAADAPATDRHVDADGRAVIPGFVDSHSHLVFAGERSAEFAARMAGTRYEAGGIRTTVQATRAASDEDLLAGARRLADEALRQGTTTIEIKSGYGLTVDDEARSLAVAAQITSEVTFLGAHVVPDDHAVDDYVALVAGEMLEACAPHARWIDVFVEEGAFGADAARTILHAGIDAGLSPRVHANQLGHGPGIRIAAEVGAASADHCTHTTDDDLTAMADGGVVATLLPGVELSTRQPYPDARRFLAAGVTVALAADCNPGSSFTTSMPLMVALGVAHCHLTPDEAVWAATAGGAQALRRDDVGMLRVGARADMVVLDAPSHLHLSYRPGVPLVHAVVRDGAC
ncbi:imidazolonepropionase [soil metagenome]